MTTHQCIFFNAKNSVVLISVGLTILGLIAGSVYAFSNQKARLENLEMSYKQSYIQIVKILEKNEEDKKEIKTTIVNIDKFLTKLSTILEMDLKFKNNKTNK